MRANEVMKTLQISRSTLVRWRRKKIEEAFADEPTKVDPFYGRENMSHLKRSISALNEGRGVAHDLMDIGDKDRPGRTG